MVWLVFALVLSAVMTILLWPLLVRRRSEAARIDYDLAVYRDQLAELDRDRGRGLLNDEQEAAARIEIQRRMLAAEEADIFIARAAMTAPDRPVGWKTGAGLLLAIPAGGLALYGWLGHPGLPGQPFAARQSDPAFERQGMIAHIETEMRQAPSAKGYRMLGDLLTQQGQYERAVPAYRQSLALGGPDAETLSLVAEDEVMANDGSVVPEARADFLAALRLDPKDPRARFYLGLAESEIGNYAKAVAIWRDLEKDSPADAPWLGMLREHIAAFAKQGGFDPGSVAPAPPAEGGVPTGAMADAIAGAAPADRQRMIRSMVDGLAARMERNPGDLDGWLRLARAYRVLGEPGKAGAARGRAAGLIAAMPAGPARAEAQGRLDSLDQ